MLANHARLLATQSKIYRYSFLGLNYAVWNWLRLGVFTGSRLAEYVQSNLRATQRYQMILNNADLGPWAGMLLAFIKKDFTFMITRIVRFPQNRSPRCIRRNVSTWCTFVFISIRVK